MHVVETFMPGSVNQVKRLFQAGALGNEKYLTDMDRHITC